MGAKDAARFFADRFKELTTGDSACSALTLDGVNDVFFSDVSRYNNTWAQTAYDKGLADAALAHALPIRIDQQLPSDILASVLYGARTVARCTSDANPCGGKDPSGPYATHGWPHCSVPSRYIELAGVALLLAPLHVRPFTDDLWTIETQGDPRTGAGARRPTVVHDLIVSTLSAGPVGFADLLNHTNASLLALATRQDGTILKPAATALRVERYYKPAPLGGREIWTAVTGPAGSADSASDSRANSLAQLGGETEEERPGRAKSRSIWWWSVFATDVDSGLPSSAPLQIDELWPRPAAGTQLLVSTVQATTAVGGNTPGPGRPCLNGSAASSCVTLWDAVHPLPIATAGAGAAAPQPKQNFTLYAAAPILESGWTLLGDLRKLVPCSPQRFVAPSATAAPTDADLQGAGGGGGTVSSVAFTVLGSVGESVAVTVVSPPESAVSPLDGTVVVIDVVIGRLGSTEVKCDTTMPVPTCACVPAASNDKM